MDAAFTAEQDEIRRTLRELLAKRSGPAEVRAAVATPEGYDTDLWHRMSGTLGLAGLALPEEYGGVGCGPAELAVAFEEAGRVLAPSPFFATAVLAAPLIAALGSERQRAELLPRIADGALTCALAVPGGSLSLALGLTGDNADASWAGGGRAGGVQARPVDSGDSGDGGDGGDGGGGRSDGAGGRALLYGEAAQVLDGHSAGLLLVAAHTGGFARSRTLLFLVRGDADGLVRERLPTLDATRPQAVVQLRDVEGELLGEDPPNGPGVLGALAAAGRTAAVMLAAEAVGAAQAALDRTVEYTGTREQFGRPIGSFQAVKHRLADLYVQVEAARSLVYCAAREAGQGGLALAAALEALRTVAGETIQLHGGIGFTWEHEAHLYFKRATADELLFGPARRLRAHAATGLFEEEAASCPSERV
ncbi:acyl-CoA dehydrogenase family protein [Streptomyces sp. ISL-36]|uniref:acyl-CoA dehydrogenase family protein n=1 Tax=Streptomyces sp. ISL-36 TaxID=2819182 RepID=UPI001BE5DF52|nr:acyl-CoA dehydrogenase family protein [Streptomyces sp. ISL-36]MBT2441725.1 acyl-CoA dehydrogenase family protein [Streptomyces sp. ISL-36]